MLDKKHCLELNATEKTKSYWEEFLLLAIAIFLLLCGLGTRTLWSSEGRWAEITREMFISGDFFHPTIGGLPYFDKPLMTYWAIAGISAVTGRLDEFIIRLPSVIAAVIAVICTIYLGKRLWSRKVGLLAGAFLLTSYGLLKYSRMASAETENLAAIMLAVTWYWIRREKPNFVSFVIFYLIMFVGSHMKGLTAFVVPVLVILPDILRQRRWRCLLRPSHLLALAIGIVVYLAPFLIAAFSEQENYQQNGLVLVFQENIQRFFQPFDHKGPVYLYFYAVPVLILPWIPILVGALITSIKNWKKLDEKTRWLIQAIALIFIFFTLSGSRRNYYILPIIPFCMLLMAIFVIEYSPEIIEKHRNRGLWIQKQVLIIAGIFEAIFVPLIIWYLINKKRWELPSLLSWSCLIIGLAIVLIGIFSGKLTGRIFQNELSNNIWSSILMTSILMGGFFAWQFNIIDDTRTEYPFNMQMKTIAQSFVHDRVAFWKMNPDKQLFYMEWDLPVTMIKDEQELQEFIQNNQPGLIIAQGRYLTESVVSMLPEEPAYAEEYKTWEDPKKKYKEKLKAWIINPNNMELAIEERSTSYAE